MKCNFSNKRQRSKELVTIAGEEVGQRDHFRYLGLVILNDG